MTQKDYFLKLDKSIWCLDLDLLRCSYGARGVWLHLILLSLELKEPGVFVGGDGQPLTKEELILLLPGKTEEISEYLSEIIEKKVIKKRKKDGAFYSKKVVDDQTARDAKSAENKRARCKAKRESAKRVEKECEKSEKKVTNARDLRSKKLEVIKKEVKEKPSDNDAFLDQEIQAIVSFVANKLQGAWVMANKSSVIDPFMSMIEVWQNEERPGYVLDALKLMLANQSEPWCHAFLFGDESGNGGLKNGPQLIQRNPRSTYSGIARAHSELSGSNRSETSEEPGDFGAVPLTNFEGCVAFDEAVEKSDDYRSDLEAISGNWKTAERDGGIVRFFFDLPPDDENLVQVAAGSRHFSGLKGYEFVGRSGS